MIKVIWEIEPAVTALTAILGRLRDLRPAWRSLVPYLRRAALEQFATQGGRGGSRWRPISPRYALQKARRYPGQPILRASDNLYRSVTDQTPESVVAIGRDEFSFGTKVPYGRYHQRGEGNNPRRRFLVVTREDRAEIKRRVRAHLQGQAGLGGFEVS